MNAEAIEHLKNIIARAIQEEETVPVAPHRPAEELQKDLDLAISQRGKSIEEVFELIGQVVRATPKTASRKYFNQLFGGRLWPATAADMLASFLNNSMYTYKVAGVQVLIEQEVLDRMLRAVGYSGGEGTFAPGGSISNMIAMIVARNEALDTIRNDGLDGRKYIVYTSDQSHYSITKNAGILGIGRHNVRRIATDGRGKMDVAGLRTQIDADRRAGSVPFFINATAGTTVLGAYDPIEEIAAVAEEQGLWLHIDGAWGGTALLSAKTRPLLAGCEAADSFTWDAHKMMGVPLIASAILMKREGLLHKHFSEQARYLFQSEEHDYNPGTRSIQCGRRNDAFKVWVAWQYFGDEGYEQRVNRQFELAAYAVEHIRRRDALKLLMQPELLCVCFQVDGKSSEAICDALDKQALIKVGYGNFRDRSYIRLVCVDPDMTFGDIDHFFEQVAQVADKL